MKNEIEINDALIAKYLTGEATPDEAVALDDWLEEPVNRLHFKKLQNTWNAAFPAKRPRQINLEKAWFDIVARREEKILSNKTQETTFLHIPKAMFRIAASILFFFVFGVTLYFIYRGEKPAEIAVSTIDTLQHIKFSDRSSVIMNRNSTISYPEAFDKNLREVHLSKGEAYFTVAPDATKPFIIHTEIANIQVIGTEFNVILNGNLLEVSVEKGKVLVYTASDSAYLEAGYTGSISPGSKSFNIRTSNSNSWAYATHKFVFKNTSLNEVFSYLEKAQGCSIQMKNRQIGNCKLTATFESVETDYILTLITEALNLTVTKNDNTFTVEGEGCQ